jgi:hypothetical protein
VHPGLENPVPDARIKRASPDTPPRCRDHSWEGKSLDGVERSLVALRDRGVLPDDRHGYACAPGQSGVPEWREPIARDVRLATVRAADTRLATTCASDDQQPTRSLPSVRALDARGMALFDMW